MNRADKMFLALKDGDWHSRREIFDRVGFMLTNNAASELRSRPGCLVEQRHGGGDYEYRLTVAPAGSPLVQPGSEPGVLGDLYSAAWLDAWSVE
jgi:hypothetical protein